MDSISLNISVLLKHMLECEYEIDDKKQETVSNKLKSMKKEQKMDARVGSIAKCQKDLLDFDGPKLILGVKNWLTFYKIMGIVNFSSVPLWISMMYKVIVLVLAIGIMYHRWAMKIFNFSIVKGSFKNPILIFISVLAFVTLVIQFLLNFRTNLFNLSPVYKILTTTKLCFVQEKVLHAIGTKTLDMRIILHLIYALCGTMMAQRNLGEFITNFNVVFFLMDGFALTVFYYHVYGLTQLDFYIRVAFGHWILALKSHMKQQFAILHKSSSTDDSILDETSACSSKPFRTITFEEIQKNLNHMDDHLEVLRSIFDVSIVLVTINSFLTPGVLCLISYHLIVNESEYYHSTLLLIAVLLSMYSLLPCYGGDRWVFYALSSFVQSIEDEYFLQHDNRGIKTQANWSSKHPNVIPQKLEDVTKKPQRSIAESNKQMLLVRKKDVLFCREFLHQFENHLATPWSKLTLKSHLHMMRTFVTLVAAQIIFEHEHEH